MPWGGKVVPWGGKVVPSVLKTVVLCPFLACKAVHKKNFGLWCPFMAMDPFDFYKDRVLMARLSSASRLGQFTAFTCMEVTAEGRRRGYFDLICG